MTPNVRPLLAGNWKMNGLKAALGELAAKRAAVERGEAGVAEVAVCPPATLIAHAASALAGSAVGLGGQDCHEKPSGAFTGDISAEMLKDAGCSYVIVGHSERRAGHGETDAMVKAKARGRAARRADGDRLRRRDARAARRRRGPGRGERAGARLDARGRDA